MRHDERDGARSGSRAGVGAAAVWFAGAIAAGCSTPASPVVQPASHDVVRIALPDVLPDVCAQCRAERAAQAASNALRKASGLAPDGGVLQGELASVRVGEVQLTRGPGRVEAALVQAALRRYGQAWDGCRGGFTSVPRPQVPFAPMTFTLDRRGRASEVSNAGSCDTALEQMELPPTTGGRVTVSVTLSFDP